MPARSAPSDKPQSMRAVLAPIENAPDLVPAMEDLCRGLAEENPFFAPSALIPALAAYGDASVRLACVWSGDALAGLWPVHKRRFYAHLPIAHWATWNHAHCYFGAPLIRRGKEEDVLRELFALLCEGDEARNFVRFGRLDRAGPLFAAIGAAAAFDNRVCYEAGAIARAMLPGGASAETTLAVHVRKKKRKEIARLRNRLGDLGLVAVREFGAGDDLGEWTQAFLTLEDRGWKGKERTSLNSDPVDAGWFRQTLARAHESGALHFIRLDLNDRPIAMLVTLRADGEAYSLKICHDPEFDRFSPGVMIEIEAMRAWLADDGFRFADSCAAPDHSMINGLWRARRVVTGLNVSGRSLGARASLSLARGLEDARARFPK